MRGAFILAYGWAILVSVSTFGVNWMAGLITLPLSLGPAYLLHRRAKTMQAGLNKFVSNFLTLAGSADEKFTYLTEDAGIAVDQKTRHVVLAKAEKLKRYPFSEIREWLTQEQTAGSSYAVGGNAMGVVLAGTQSMAAHSAAARNSGLTIRVKDMDHPEWFFQMDKPTRARWFEIFTQMVNES